ncbi:MAG: anti-sigma F factor [Clostridia bacterium]|nr:anti-sigma F factor [Clostridia bacterium]
MAVQKYTERNRFTIRFPSKSANESFARSVAAAFAAQLDPTLDELGDIRTAVSEAVTNAIVHGYRDTIGIITLTVRLLEPDAVEIVVSDKGCGIPDIRAAREPLFTTGGAERSGMGFTIMENFMDSLKVRSKPGQGTTVTMRKRLHTRRYGPVRNQ